MTGLTGTHSPSKISGLCQGVLKSAAVTVLVATLSACSFDSVFSDSPKPVVATTASIDPVADFIGTAPAGSADVQDVPDFGGLVKIVPGDTYNAASGRTCRSFMTYATQGAISHGVACQTATGWKISRTIVAGRTR